jgi:toxin-antitoxin system PIN domain toxin
MASDRRPRLLDVNVLVALTWPQHVHHAAAHRWLAGLGTRRFATCPSTEQGLLRLSTNPHVVGRQVTFAEALAVLGGIRAQRRHVFIADDSTLAEPAIDLGRAVVSSQVTELALVNLAAAAGAVLATFDRAIPTYLADADRGHVELIG